MEALRRSGRDLEGPRWRMRALELILAFAGEHPIVLIIVVFLICSIFIK